MYNKNRYDIIDDMKKNITTRLKTSNTHKRKINQTYIVNTRQRIKTELSDI